jgi:hypothetical protein
MLTLLSLAYGLYFGALFPDLNCNEVRNINGNITVTGVPSQCWIIYPSLGSTVFPETITLEQFGTSAIYCNGTYFDSIYPTNESLLLNEYVTSDEVITSNTGMIVVYLLGPSGNQCDMSFVWTSTGSQWRYSYRLLAASLVALIVPWVMMGPIT